MKNEENEISEDIDLKIDKHFKSTMVFGKTNSQPINDLLGDFIIIDSKKEKEEKEKEKEKEKKAKEKETEINPDIIKKQKLFASKKYYTTIGFKRKKKDFFQTKQRININNITKNRINIINNNTQLNKNFAKRNLIVENNSKKEKEYAEYSDFYFDDEMFISESSSFPNEKQDFFQKLQFIEENNFNNDIENFDIRHCSINYKINQRDQTYIKYFDSPKNDISEKKLPELDNIYKEEKEEIGKNIFYIDNQKSSPYIKIITKNSNKNENKIINDNLKKTISYISINLLIKKVTLENFRYKFAFIYKCFLEQFKYFIPINSLINKIFSAFYYYHETMKVDSAELLLFLNTLVYENFDLIKDDKTTLKQLQEFYNKINETKWENPEIIQDLNSIYYLLFKSFKNINVKIDVDEIVNQNQINEVKKNNYPFEYNKAKSMLINDKKITSSKGNGKKVRYFYIFNFKKEVIAQYLTCESYQILSDIPETELYNKNFARKDKDIRAPHIKKIFDRYEKLTYFIIEDICSYDNISERVDSIEKWIRIAGVCQELKNYNDLIMLNTLFCHYLLQKNLKKTWAKLSKKSINYLDRINKFCSGAQCYKIIRNEIFKCKGPYVPYIGILLKQLTYIEEKKYIIDNNNINIDKLVELNKTIGKFFEFKKYKYNFDKSKNLEVLSHANPKSEDEIENIIKQIEPKLVIHSKKGDKKRLTKTDEMFYV